MPLLAHTEYCTGCLHYMNVGFLVSHGSLILLPMQSLGVDKKNRSCPRSLLFVKRGYTMVSKMRNSFTLSVLVKYKLVLHMLDSDHMTYF